MTNTGRRINAYCYSLVQALSDLLDQLGEENSPFYDFDGHNSDLRYWVRIIVRETNAPNQK